MVTVLAFALILVGTVALGLALRVDTLRRQRDLAAEARDALGEQADADHATIVRQKAMLLDSAEAVGRANDRTQEAEAKRLVALADLAAEQKAAEGYLEQLRRRHADAMRLRDERIRQLEADVAATHRALTARTLKLGEMYEVMAAWVAERDAGYEVH